MQASIVSDNLCWDVLSAYPNECRALSVSRYHGHRPLEDHTDQWRVETASGPFCLRRRAKDSISTERLQFTQAVLWYALQEAEGGRIVLLPQETQSHHGFVQRDDAYWEMIPWAMHTPLDQAGTDIETVCAAMLALAELHEATESFPIAEMPEDISPAVRSMQKRLQHDWNRRFPGIVTKMSAKDTACSPYDEPARRIVQAVPRLVDNITTLMDRSLRMQVAMQPCLGRVSRSHVYLEERDLAYFGNLLELTVDNASLDIAHLLGSIARNDHWQWVAGLNAYQMIRPLSSDEKYLVVAMDRALHWLDGIDWLDRIYCRDEKFSSADESRVAGRLAEIAERLDFFVKVTV